jgi:hypothetical protein
MKNTPAAAGALLADGHANPQKQIIGFVDRPQLGQRLLSLAQRGPLASTMSALTEVKGNALHLPPIQTAIQIF